MNPHNARTAARGVLLVEDSEDDVLLFGIAWRRAKLSYELRHVEDGRQAIAYLMGSEPFEDRAQYPEPFLILLDLKLPEIRGFEVLAWIRARSEWNATSVAVLSSSPERSDIERAYQTGANCYLTKPLGARALRELVELAEAKGTDARALLPVEGAERPQTIPAVRVQ